MSIRARLTASYGALFLASGVGLLAINYVLVDRATSEETVTIVFDGGGSASTTVRTDRPEESHPEVGGWATGATAPDMPDPAEMHELARRQHAAHMRTLLVQSASALAVMTGLAAVLGWLMANRALRPLRAVTAATRRITARNLDERLDLDGPDDEVKELAETVDDLLARIDRAFQAQRRFVANASHELRTPLTRQRAIAQVALDDPAATADSLRAAHERALAAGARQEQLIEALLALARGQDGRVEAEPLDLGALAREARDGLADDAARARVTITTALAEAPIRGDPKLVERLVANLVANAIRHNHPGGSVEIATAGGPAGPTLAVENSGPVIGPGQVDDLFEPFRRLDSGRAGDGHGHGHGLGLSIVRAVADAHGAAVRATARPAGGLRVEVRFRSPTPDAPNAAAGAARPRPGPPMPPAPGPGRGDTLVHNR